MSYIGIVKFLHILILNKSEVIRTPTDDFGDRHTNQLILRSLKNKKK